MASHPPLYKAVWYWKDDHLAYDSAVDGKEKLMKQQTRQAVAQDSKEENTIYFVENVDQKIFKLKHQRPDKQNMSNVILLQDIKDAVTFSTVGTISKKFLALLYSYEINSFLRTLIVYFQLYLQVLDDLMYRRRCYSQQRLKHPISIVRETLCITNLSKLRSRIGQEYALLIAGEGKYKRFHHMNNKISRSYTTHDIKLYEHLIKFTSRIIWVALYRSQYKEIKLELSRLFHCDEEKNLNIDLVKNGKDMHVLHGHTTHFSSVWQIKSPVIMDIFINQDNPECFLSNNLKSLKVKGTKVTKLDAMLTLPEELLDKFGLNLGILGQPRNKFEPMLHLKQGLKKTLEEEELEKLQIRLVAEAEKPTIKMYQSLKELEEVIDLKIDGSNESRDIVEEIKHLIAYHIEEEKKALNMWNNAGPPLQTGIIKIVNDFPDS